MEEQNKNTQTNNKTLSPKRGSESPSNNSTSDAMEPPGIYIHSTVKPKRTLAPPGSILQTGTQISQTRTNGVQSSSAKAIDTEIPSSTSGYDRCDASSSSSVNGSKVVQIVSNRPANFIRKDPKLANYNDRRRAARILKRLETDPITEDQVSKEDFQKVQDDILWARAVLPNFTLFHTPDPSRRKLPMEESSAQKQLAKKPKTQCESTKSIADITKEKLIIGIVDESSENGRISKHQWSLIEAALAKVAINVLKENPGEPPSCTDAGWFEGCAKLMACNNKRSIELFKKAINKLGEVYPGARLKVVAPKDLPKRPKALIRVPDAPSEPDEILEILKICNPTYPTQNWKVIKLAPKPGEKNDDCRMNIVLVMNNESIDLLAKNDNRLCYGFTQVYARIYEVDTETLVKSLVLKSGKPSKVDVNEDVSSVDAESRSDPESSRSFK